MLIALRLLPTCVSVLSVVEEAWIAEMELRILSMIVVGLSVVKGFISLIVTVGCLCCASASIVTSSLVLLLGIFKIALALVGPSLIKSIARSGEAVDMAVME